MNHEDSHSCSPTASPSSSSSVHDVNINAVNIFQPLKCSSIPTDIRLVGVDDDSDDEFDTPDQSPVHDTDDPIADDTAVDCQNAPPTTPLDPHDWEDDDTDDVRALIDTGAMVTCTGDKHIIHRHKPCNELHRCPI